MCLSCCFHCLAYLSLVFFESLDVAKCLPLFPKLLVEGVAKTLEINVKDRKHDQSR